MVEPLKSLEDTILQLGYLTTLLGETYDFQYDKDVDLSNLGEAVDALAFANTKLIEQKKIQTEHEKRRLAQLTKEK
jgi:hypothetical protein